MANEEHLRRLKEGVESFNKWRKAHPDEIIDLSHAELSGEDFSISNIEVGEDLITNLRRLKNLDPGQRGVNLETANLKRANLEGVNFEHVNLQGANLTSANLKGANLQFADLQKADLTNANLEGANLSLAGILYANLTRANLKSVDLSSTYLGATNIDGAIFTQANLEGSDLERVYLFGANFERANLSGANLTEANLEKANLKGANLTEAILNRANLSESNISHANLSKAYLNDALINNSLLIGTILSRTSFVHSDLSSCDISGAIMEDISISGWKINGIKCTHIIRDGKRIEYEEGQFEKIFTNVENLSEIMIELPFSDITYYTARFIEYIINNHYGKGSILLKDISALSNDTTKLSYLNWKEDKELDAINNIFISIQEEIKPITKYIKDETSPKPLISLKEKYDLKLFELNTETATVTMLKAYNQLPQALQSIFHKIQSLF